MGRPALPALDGKTIIRLQLIDRVAQSFNSLIRAIMVIGVAYECVEAIRALAGQDTAVLVTFLTNTGSGLTAVAGAGVGGLGGVYGLWQRRLRQRSIAHLAPRLARYEKLVDPNRTSSGLTETGLTNPDDE
jgi:hypothetical protein